MKQILQDLWLWLGRAGKKSKPRYSDISNMKSTFPNWLPFSNHNARFQDNVLCFVVFWLTNMFSLQRESKKKNRNPNTFWLLFFLGASHCIRLYEIYGLKENKSCITIIIDAWKIQSEYNYNNKSAFRFNEIQLVG